jgi:hypothetical protein
VQHGDHQTTRAPQHASSTDLQQPQTWSASRGTPGHHAVSLKRSRGGGISESRADGSPLADPEVEETVKRTVQPYFVLQGTVCALLATKDHVNLFLYDGGLAPDPHGIITSGHGNSTGRTISYYQGDVIPEGPLLDILRSIIADNCAGGWRRIKAQNPR